MNPAEIFRERATAYCTLVSESSNLSRDDFLKALQHCLPTLYLAALNLPPVAANAIDFNDRLTHAQWKKVYDHISTKLGTSTLYWHISDPLTLAPEDPVASTITDDLADIWRDLAPGLASWSTASEETRQAILWQWQFSFKSHWSTHLVDALHIINRLI